METHDEQTGTALRVGPNTVVVKVNNRNVSFTEDKVTGKVIKATAIAQGVPIQLDFHLFEVKPNQPLKQIRDDETVTLHIGEQFRATAPDDNS